MRLSMSNSEAGRLLHDAARARIRRCVAAKCCRPDRRLRGNELAEMNLFFTNEKLFVVLIQPRV